MIVRHLFVPLTVAVFATSVIAALGQTPFPAPLPHGAVGTVNDPAFPPVRGSVGTPDDSAFPPVNGASARRTALPRQDSAFPPVNGTTPPTGAPASGSAAPVGNPGCIRIALSSSVTRRLWEALRVLAGSRRAPLIAW